MSSKGMIDRLGILRKVPPIAAIDHRHFLDEHGNDRRLENLPRTMRRRLKADGRRLMNAYNKILESIQKSGAGYPVDNLVRQLTIEYTHRYATSGIGTQPVNFNYFEPFCDVRFIEDSVAPYAVPAQDLNHLFGVSDYFDYITGGDGARFSLSALIDLPEGRVLHFTANGSTSDFTFSTAEGREFVISGFSMVRHQMSLHWFLLGGEVYSENEWEEMKRNQIELEPGYAAPSKLPFMEAALNKFGSRSGPPIALEGTDRAMRTIVCGETDLLSTKHLGRMIMTERERVFDLVCDDPDILRHEKDLDIRTTLTRQIHDRVEAAAVVWNVAEAMFQLPSYFRFKFEISKSIAVSQGQRLPRPPRGGEGTRNRFRYVSALEISTSDTPIVRTFASPRYDVETEGHWRRLAEDQEGEDAYGNRVKGKTWVKEVNDWRQRSSERKTLYIKSSVAAARIQVAQYLRQAEEQAANQPNVDSSERQSTNVVYVLRCAAMQEEVYKVGWTSGTAEARAKSLSSASGVPTSFVVVESWPHPEAEALEKDIHAMLAPYRVDGSREFFAVSFLHIKKIVESQIQRACEPR